MSDTARRVFKIELILDFLVGKTGDSMADLLSFLIGRDLSSADAAIVAPLVKAWIYTQLPALMGNSYEEHTVYEEWVQAQIRRLGFENVSMLAIPEGETAAIVALLDTLAMNQDIIKEQAAKIEELEGTIEALEPLQEQVIGLKKKIERQEDKITELESKIRELNVVTAKYNDKIPIAENEINQTIKEIVTKALKDAIASIPLGVQPSAVIATTGTTEEVTAEPQITFGLGISEPDSDGFGF